MRKLMMLVALVALILASLPGVAMADVEKVTICHKPGTPAEKTLNVPASAVPGHLGHGDYLGECEGPGPDPDPCEQNPDLPECVNPPGPPGPHGNNGGNGNDGTNGKDGRDAPALACDLNQNAEQEADSGDLDQSVNITGGGDNSNQIVGNQVVGNTGNAQTQTLFGGCGGSGDTEISGGSSIDLSPFNSTSGVQEVNQEAIAY